MSIDNLTQGAIVLAIFTTLVFAELALGAEKVYITDLPKTQLTKVDAILKLANDRKSVVYQCQQVELTDKATLRNK